MMNILILLLTAYSVSSSAIERRDVQPLNHKGLQTLLTPFREAILQMVAVGWNHTITDSEKLKVDMQHCSETIKASVATCRTCATAACQHKPGGQQAVAHSPTFTDYLKVAANIVNPYTYLKEPLNEVGNRLGDLVDILGSGSKSFIDSMSGLANTVGDGFTDVFHGLETGLNTVKGGLTDAGNTIAGLGGTVIHGIGDLGGTAVDKIGDAAHTVAGAVTDAAHSVGHFFQNIFGKRALTAEVRQCMQQCDSCKALLSTDQRAMVKAVCGDNVVQFNDTVRDNVSMIKSIFISVSDKQHPIISKIEVDPTSLNGTCYSRVFVTANVKGHYVRYQTNVNYDMMEVVTTGRQLAVELWKKWM